MCQSLFLPPSLAINVGECTRRPSPQRAVAAASRNTAAAVVPCRSSRSPPQTQRLAAAVSVGREVSAEPGRLAAPARVADATRPQKGGFTTKGEARAALNDALRRLSVGEPYRRDPPTLAELVEEYLDQHVAAEITITTLRYRLEHAVDVFGRTRIDRLTAPAVGAWRKQLPAGSAHYIHRSLRQVLA